MIDFLLLKLISELVLCINIYETLLNIQSAEQQTRARLPRTWKQVFRIKFPTKTDRVKE